MPQPSRIEWTEYTWNPVTGCSKVSSGCLNCYAERMAKRLQAMGVRRYEAGFQARVHNDLIHAPLAWQKPRIIFVNSMSDLFHEDVPDFFIKKVFGTMVRCPQHTFQVLTKRSGRLLQLSDELPWTPNIWMGVTIEDEENMSRADHLRGCGAKVKFLSCEPLLGSISSLHLDGIDWVIVGGESGPNARPMRLEWVTAIRDLCMSAGIPYFFKQWGGWNKKATGRTLEGRVWDERPVLAQGLLPVF